MIIDAKVQQKLYIEVKEAKIMQAKENSVVEIEYEGRLEDGKLFDTNKEELAKKEHSHVEGRLYEPLHVQLGSGMVIKGFEKNIIGMEEGEEKTFKVTPEEGYGNRDENLVKKFPRDPQKDADLKAGMMIVVNVQGQEYPAVVNSIDEKEVTIDFNHPLGGKILTFKVKLVKVESSN